MFYYVEKQLSFNTNDMTKIVFEKAFKDIPKKDLDKVLGSNVKIKSLYLNKDNMVYVDFLMKKGEAFKVNLKNSIESK